MHHLEATAMADDRDTTAGTKGQKSPRASLLPSAA